MLEQITTGDELQIVDKRLNQIGSIRSMTDIPSGHKISLTTIKKDELVIKFGIVIGRSTADIQKGHYVHIHNVMSIAGAEKTKDRKK